MRKPPTSWPRLTELDGSAISGTPRPSRRARSRAAYRLQRASPSCPASSIQPDVAPELRRHRRRSQEEEDEATDPGSGIHADRERVGGGRPLPPGGLRDRRRDVLHHAFWHGAVEHWYRHEAAPRCSRSTRFGARCLLDAKHFRKGQQEGHHRSSSTGYKWHFLGVEIGWVPGSVGTSILPFTPPMWSEVTAATGATTSTRPTTTCPVRHATTTLFKLGRPAAVHVADRLRGLGRLRRHRRQAVQLRRAGRRPARPPRPATPTRSRSTTTSA